MKIASINASGNPVISIPEDDFIFDGIWFLVEEKNVPKPMMAIHAINGSQVKRGTVLFSNALDGVSFTQDQHIGFVRWFKEDLKLQKVSISEGWNKNNISELLFDVANAFISHIGIEGSISK